MKILPEHHRRRKAFADELLQKHDQEIGFLMGLEGPADLRGSTYIKLVMTTQTIVLDGI